MLSDANRDIQRALREEALRHGRASPKRQVMHALDAWITLIEDAIEADAERLPEAELRDLSRCLFALDARLHRRLLRCRGQPLEVLEVLFDTQEALRRARQPPPRAMSA